jgi:hypothetical protein
MLVIQRSEVRTSVAWFAREGLGKRTLENALGERDIKKSRRDGKPLSPRAAPRRRRNTPRPNVLAPQHQTLMSTVAT